MRLSFRGKLGLVLGEDLGGFGGIMTVNDASQSGPGAAAFSVELDAIVVGLVAFPEAT